MLTRTTDERYTPSWIVEYARQVMGGIDMDPASCEVANRVVKAATFYTREIDGLRQPWIGRVFLNPPFGVEWKRWIEKLAWEVNAGRTQQALVVGQGNVMWAIGAPWFRPLYPGSIWLPYDGPKFLDPASGKSLGVRYGTFGYYFGNRQVRFASVFGRSGTVLRPVAASALLPVAQAENDGHQIEQPATAR